VLLISSCTKVSRILIPIQTDQKITQELCWVNWYRIVNSSVTASRNFTHELMQVDAPRSSPSGRIAWYVVNPGSAVWSDFYGYMTDIDDIYKTSETLGRITIKRSL
jgi:hypothetical protein